MPNATMKGLLNFPDNCRKKDQSLGTELSAGGLARHEQGPWLHPQHGKKKGKMVITSVCTEQFS